MDFQEAVAAAEQMEEEETVKEPEKAITLSREDLWSVSREVMAELFYEICEFMTKPELAKSDPFRPISSERQQFSEYEWTMYHLKCHYGNGIFKPLEKYSKACKVTKVSKHKLEEHLQRAVAEGKAECIDADGARCEWRMK